MAPKCLVGGPEVGACEGNACGNLGGTERSWGVFEIIEEDSYDGACEEPLDLWVGGDGNGLS